MSGDEPKGGAEASAQKWPPEDYALWVQSQIANRMFGRIVRWVGSISLLTVLALATALYTYSERIIDQVKDGIVADVTKGATESIRADLPQTVKTEVLEQLIQQAGLVDTARAKVLEQLDILLGERLKDPEFQAQAAEAILQALDAEGGVTRVLMDNALARARAEDTPDAVRAFGVQLYTLLATNAGTSGDGSAIRQNLLSVASAPAPGDRAGVLRALLVHYPLNDHTTGGAGAAAGGCRGRADYCTRQDGRMVRLMLTQLTRNPEAQRDLLPEFRGFFRRMAPEHYRMLADRTARDPQNPALVEINLGIARSGAPELRAALVREMSAFVGAADRPDLRLTGLRVLAALDPMAEFAAVPDMPSRDAASREVAERSFEVRIEALARLWAAQPPETLRIAFEAATETAVANAPPPDDAAALTRTAIVALLRTDPVADPEAVNHDWRDIVEGRLTPDVTKGPNPVLYAAWVARARLDAATGRPVDWAADQLLASLGRWRDRLSDPLVLDATRFAVAQASPDRFRQFAEGLSGFAGERMDASGPLPLLVAAAVARERQEERFDWIESVLAGRSSPGGAGQGDAFAHLVMANLSSLGAGGAKEGDTAAAIRGAAEFAAELYARDDPARHRLADLALRRALAHEGRCETWVAIEDSRVAADLHRGRFAGVSPDGSALADLAERTPWIGAPPEPGMLPAVLAAEEPMRLDFDRPGGPGGAWHWIAVDAPINALIDLPSRTELVVMNADRSERMADRLTASGALPLPAGVLALGLRACGEAPPPDASLVITASAAPLPLAAASREAPGRISGTARLRYDGLAEAGQVWIELELGAGDVLAAETRGAGGTDVDTQLWLYDAASGDELAYNDDVSESLYSRVEYRAATGHRLLLKAAKYDDAPFVRGDGFDLRIDVGRAGEAPTLAETPDAAPEVAIGRPLLLTLPGVDVPGYLGLTTPREAMLVLDTAGEVLSVEDGRGQPAAGFVPVADGSNVFRLNGGERYLVQLVPPLGRGLVAFHARPFTGFHDLSASTAPPETPLLLTAPAALNLPAGRVEVPVRAGADLQTVHLVLSGAPGALVGAAVKVHPDTPGAPVHTVALSPGLDGTLEGDWQAEAGEDYKIAFVFGVTGAPVFAALQMAPRRGYMGLGPDDRVRLGRHTAIGGDDNWNAAMDAYVGCLARITELAGAEPGQTDLYRVRVDLDAGEWLWRVVDLEPVSDTEPQPDHCPG
jgi:hypothetical protein